MEPVKRPLTIWGANGVYAIRALFWAFLLAGLGEGLLALSQAKATLGVANGLAFLIFSVSILGTLALGLSIILGSMIALLLGSQPLLEVQDRLARWFRSYQLGGDADLALLARSTTLLCLMGLLLAGQAKVNLAIIQGFQSAPLAALATALLTIILLALLGLASIPLHRACLGLVRGLGRANRRLLPRVPLVSMASLAILALLGAGTALILFLRATPSVLAIMPWRALGLGAFSLVMTLFFLWWLPRRRVRPLWARATLGATGLLALSLGLIASIFPLASRQGVKFVAINSTDFLSRSVHLLRGLSDRDKDGYSSILGENDCAPLNPAIHPGAIDLPDNGIDEDCDGSDLLLADLKLDDAKAGEGKFPVPKSFQKDYNVIFILVDALRADSVSFHGYKRKTSPNIDQLAEESVAFMHTHAPSAGTVASMPAILSSRFFHTQMDLGPERPGKPPKVLGSNLMMAEMLKTKEYVTAAILTHHWFTGWGLDQGFDFYDNELGERLKDPKAITSHLLTDKAIDFLEKNQNQKFFMWLHYYDVHSDYVKHPEVADYGDRPIDVYDSEITYTDKHLGRLLDFLRQQPCWDRTIVVLTADHGDGFKEHGIVAHGSALYREIIHVPMIWRVPGLPPKKIHQASSPLDIMPTLAHILDIPVETYMEGSSLVGSLFYGHEDPDREVHSETNWPAPLRAAISTKWKIIYDLKSNLTLLFDLKKDPWEKRDLYHERPQEAARLSKSLTTWLQRAVYVASDHNQSFRDRKKSIFKRLPRGAKALGIRFGEDVEVAGVKVSDRPIKAGDKITIDGYFRSTRALKDNYRMMAVLKESLPTPLKPADEPAPKGRPLVLKDKKVPLFGFYPTTMWKKTDLVQVDFSFRMPATARPGQYPLYLAVITDQGKRLPVMAPMVGAERGLALVAILEVKGEEKKL